MIKSDVDGKCSSFLTLYLTSETQVWIKWSEDNYTEIWLDDHFEEDLSKAEFLTKEQIQVIKFITANGLKKI